LKSNLITSEKRSNECEGGRDYENRRRKEAYPLGSSRNSSARFLKVVGKERRRKERVERIFFNLLEKGVSLPSLPIPSTDLPFRPSLPKFD